MPNLLNYFMDRINMVFPQTYTLFANYFLEIGNLIH